MWSKTQKVAIADLITDGLQARVSIDQERVAEYAAVLGEGGTLPPITVFWDSTTPNTFYLADGHHRRAAYIEAGRTEISCEVRPGTRRAAFEYALGANSSHGLPRSNADKRHSVSLALQDSEFVQLSDRQLAKLCGTTHPFVAKVRTEMGMRNEFNTDLTDEQLLHLAAQLSSEDMGNLYAIVSAPSWNSSKKLERRRLAIVLDGLLTITAQGRRLVALRAAADPFLALELLIAAETKNLTAHHYGTLGAVLKEVYQQGGWVEFRNMPLLSYRARGWSQGLVKYGYLVEHQSSSSELHWHIVHITPAGCALIGKPELPIAPLPPPPTADSKSVYKPREVSPEEKHAQAVEYHERNVHQTRHVLLGRLKWDAWVHRELRKYFPGDSIAIEKALVALVALVEAATPLPPPVMEMESVTSSESEAV